jgi:hypothetical protein
MRRFAQLRPEQGAHEALARYVPNEGIVTGFWKGTWRGPNGGSAET